MSIPKFLLKRLTGTLFSIIISVTIVFLIPRLVPGDPLASVFNELYREGSTMQMEELVLEYKKIFGLDKDIFNQYIYFLIELFKGNLGYSIYHFPTKVSELIMRYLPWTLGLLITTYIISWVVGTFLGAIAGWRGEKSRLLKATVPFLLLLRGLPYYILAMLLLFGFAYTFRFFPSTGAYSIGNTPAFSLEFIGDVFMHSFLPSVCLVLGSLTWWFLGMRSMISTVKGEDYILFAEAEGLKKSSIMWRFAFRNAILPQVTGLSLSLAHTVSGAVLTEILFAYPGIGFLIYTSIRNLDYPVTQGCVLIVILCVCLTNFIMDLVYPLLDPRIRYGER